MVGVSRSAPDCAISKPVIKNRIVVAICRVILSLLDFLIVLTANEASPTKND